MAIKRLAQNRLTCHRIAREVRMRLVLVAVAIVGIAITSTQGRGQLATDGSISPSRPVPVGKAPGMQVKTISDTPGEKVYAIIFHKGDEALSGLTDFAIQNKVGDAHFTAIGASSGALLALLQVEKKSYRPIPVTQQVEVLSLIGDIATFNGKPVVHMHAVLGKPDGSTVGGHVFELHVNPTLEVFMTVDTTPLQKKPDDASGMKFIDPAQ